MAQRGIELPNKLKKDAIIEAIFEVQFDMSSLPEVLFGQLATYLPWKQFKQRRMPAYNVPAALRQADVNLRFQPIFELSDPNGKRAIRIGPNVLSFHLLPPYIGWQSFQIELNEAIQQLFANVQDLTIRRMGLRYINALTISDHNIRSIYDLDLDIKIAQENVPASVNLNFSVEMTNNTKCTVRIATADSVQGVLPEQTSLVIDVDVYTRENFKTKDINEVKAWIVFAHQKEKEEFFHLLTDVSIKSLREE